MSTVTVAVNLSSVLSNSKSLHRTDVPPLLYNIKHVHMCIVLTINRVMCDNENKPHP